MAEVIGFLREDATRGERQTLKLLSRNLPKDFAIYVESPIHKKRDIRYPAVEIEIPGRSLFVLHLRNTFRREEDEYVLAERRIHMAMSRAREKLYMTYFGKLPRPYEDLRSQNPEDFVG